MAESSRLYSPAIARLTPLTMVETGRAVVLELLGAVGDLNAGAFADVLVVGAFVGILEAAPAADVIDEDDREVRLAAFDVLDQLLQ